MPNSDSILDLAEQKLDQLGVYIRNAYSCEEVDGEVARRREDGEGRARSYVILADRLQFHLEAGTLPAEAAEHVRRAHDALMKASAALRGAEMPRDQNAGTEDQTVR